MSTSKSGVNETELPFDKPKTLEEALRLLREDAKGKGVDKLTMEEIDAEIAAYRREEREKEPAGK